jgi:alpha-amylase
LHCDHDLYIMQRTGTDRQRGLLFVLNNSGRWNGSEVITQWPNKELIPLAWNGQGATAPMNKWTNADGVCDVWAPPRGYAVYIPQ